MQSLMPMLNALCDCQVNYDYFGFTFARLSSGGTKNHYLQFVGILHTSKPIDMSMTILALSGFIKCILCSNNGSANRADRRISFLCMFF